MKISALFFSMMAAATLLAESKETKLAAEGPDHECTSWMIFSDLTGNNTNILHKNRDATARSIAVMTGGHDSPRRWIAMGTLWKGTFYTCMAMNSSGLAVVMNSGEPTPENTEDLKWTTGRDTSLLTGDIIAKCDTAAQGVEMLKNFIEKKDYSHKQKGSIYFFVDPKEGYIVELTALFVSVRRIDRGYDFRANIWHNPGMAQRSCIKWKGFFQNVVREYSVISSFNKALDRNGRLGLADSLALSRDSNAVIDVPIDRRVCYKYTNSASSLVVDREFPDVLSVGYMTIGHPRNTLWVPIPVCVEKLDKRMD